MLIHRDLESNYGDYEKDVVQNVCPDVLCTYGCLTILSDESMEVSTWIRSMPHPPTQPPRTHRAHTYTSTVSPHISTRPLVYHPSPLPRGTFRPITKLTLLDACPNTTNITMTPYLYHLGLAVSEAREYAAPMLPPQSHTAALYTGRKYADEEEGRRATNLRSRTISQQNMERSSIVWRCVGRADLEKMQGQEKSSSDSRLPAEHMWPGHALHRRPAARQAR
jgi:hypothetical protein